MCINEGDKLYKHRGPWKRSGWNFQTMKIYVNINIMLINNYIHTQICIATPRNQTVINWRNDAPGCKLCPAVNGWGNKTHPPFPLR